MSSKTKSADAKEEAAPALVPKLRFPEFWEEPGWNKTQLQKVARPVSDRAVTGDGDNVLSLSGEHGLVLQSDYFGKKVAGDSAERYLKLVRNDFVYNDRTTKASTFGTIKRLSKYDGGIVSPIYKCFRFHADENPVFWEWYFESGSHDAALGGLVNEGARAGRFNISITQFLSTAAWRPDEPEQQKIAECLSSVDELMAAQARKVDALKTHKKGLMQQLFPREGETQPRLRFPEFQNAGEWERENLDGALDQVSNGLSLTQGNEASLYRVTRIETISSGAIDLERVGYVDTTQDISAYKVKVGDILFSNINSVAHIGKSVFVDADYDLYHGMNLLRLVAKRSKCEPKFLFYLINTGSVRESFRERANKAVNQASINQTELGKTELALPSLPEQQRIATCLSSLDALITAETQKLEALKTHKKGLMQQLFPSPEEVEG